MTTTSDTRSLVVGDLCVEYSPSSDMAYIHLADGRVYHTAELSDRCALDYTADGRIIGLDMSSVSEGVELAGLPRAEEVQRALREVGIPTF